MDKHYIRLTDGQCERAIRVETGKIEAIQLPTDNQSALRGQIYRVDEDDIPVETLDFAKPRPDLFKHYLQAFKIKNRWCVDWPHLPTELEGTPDRRARLANQLYDICRDLPYELTIIGLQRRFLLYYSDGNSATQKTFIRMSSIPTGQAPFDDHNRLKPAYTLGLTLAQVRNTPDTIPFHGEPALDLQERERRCIGSPLLYAGPAWVVRFMLDDQITALGGCRVYVTDRGDFICSDWCQRDGRTHYEEGIDLQSGHFTFASWIGTSSVQYALQNRSFTPKNGTVQIHEVRHLIEKHDTPAVPVKHLLTTVKQVDTWRTQAGDQTEDYVVKQVRAAYQALLEFGTTKLTEEQKAWLQEAPVQLAPKTPPWSEVTQQRYGQGCLLDLNAQNTFYSSLHIVGYQGDHESCAVEPGVMEIDETRLRTMCNAGSTLTASALTQAKAFLNSSWEMQEATFSVVAAKAAQVAAQSKKLKGEHTCTKTDCYVKLVDGIKQGGAYCYGPGHPDCLYTKQNIITGLGVNNAAILE